MDILGIIFNMIAIVVLGDYGLFGDGVAVHEDSAIYFAAWELRDAIVLGWPK